MSKSACCNAPIFPSDITMNDYCEKCRKPCEPKPERCPPKTIKERKAAIKKRLIRKVCSGCGNYLDYCVCPAVEAKPCKHVGVILPNIGSKIQCGLCRNWIIVEQYPGFKK